MSSSSISACSAIHLLSSVNCARTWTFHFRLFFDCVSSSDSFCKRFACVLISTQYKKDYSKRCTFNDPARRQCLNCCKFSAHRIHVFLTWWWSRPSVSIPCLCHDGAMTEASRDHFSVLTEKFLEQNVESCFAIMEKISSFCVEICFAILEKIIYFL